MEPIQLIPLVTGRAGEWANGCEQYAVHLTYDLKPILEKWPDVMLSVAFERADGKKYAHAWERAEDILHIPLTKADTAVAGQCKCVVTVVSGDGQHNSDVFYGRVSLGLDTLGEEPDEPMQGIIEQVNGAAVRAEGAAQSAAETLDAVNAAGEEQKQEITAAGAQQIEQIQNSEVVAQIVKDAIADHFAENEITADAIGAASKEALEEHTQNQENPHGVTAEQTGAASKEALAEHTQNQENPHGVTAEQTGAASKEALEEHTQNQENPHGVTAEQLGAATWETVYPVGAVYISTNSTSPASLFGGSWEQIKERFLFGASDTYTAGGTGGEFGANHKHLTSIGYDGQTFYGIQGEGGGIVSNGIAGAYVNKTSVTAHNTQFLAYTNDVWLTNMPPYLNVYMWKRTA